MGKKLQNSPPRSIFPRKMSRKKIHRKIHKKYSRKYIYCTFFGNFSLREIFWRRKLDRRGDFLSIFSGISWRRFPAKSRGLSGAKSLFPWVSKDILATNLAPTPSRRRPPPHQKNIQTQKFRFGFLLHEEDKRATTNVQNRFAPFFLLSFFLFYSPWAKALCFEGESPGGWKLWKSAKKCENVKNYETILPFSCCPLVFPWFFPGNKAEKFAIKIRHQNSLRNSPAVFLKFAGPK